MKRSTELELLICNNKFEQIGCCILRQLSFPFLDDPFQESFLHFDNDVTMVSL